MDEPSLVRLVECIADLNRDFQGFRDRKRPTLDSLVEGFALQEFHHQVADAILFADIVQGANMRMMQARDGAGLALKALLQIISPAHHRRKNLNSDLTIEPSVAGTINLTHAAGANGRQDLVRSQTIALGQ